MRDSTHQPSSETNSIDNGRVVPFSSIGARVQNVRMEGHSRTKDDVLMKNVQSIFDVRNVQDLMLKSLECCENLNKSGCFSKASVQIDLDDDPSHVPKFDAYKVTFIVEEPNRVGGGVQLMQSTDSTKSASLNMSAPNLLGRGEHFGISYSKGTNHYSSWNAKLAKPFYLPTSKIRFNLSTSINKQMSETVECGYGERDGSVNIVADFPWTPYLTHSLQWEGTWRRLNYLKHNAMSYAKGISKLPGVENVCLLEEMGDSLKSAVRSQFTFDNRHPNSVLPTHGHLFRMTNELAGLGGDASFLKNTFDMQWNKSLFSHDFIQLQSSVQLGLLVDRNVGGMSHSSSSSSSSLICDRFFLGGPTSLRGFHWKGLHTKPMNSVSLDDENSSVAADLSIPSSSHQSKSNPSAAASLGGSCFWNAALHVYTRIPFLPIASNSFISTLGIADRVKTHFFVNGGDLRHLSDILNRMVDFGQSRGDNNNADGDNRWTRALLTSTRWTLGVGLAINILDAARLEINYCLPMNYLRGDKVAPGLQFGLGIDFV